MRRGTQTQTALVENIEAEFDLHLQSRRGHGPQSGDGINEEPRFDVTPDAT